MQRKYQVLFGASIILIFVGVGSWAYWAGQESKNESMSVRFPETKCEESARKKIEEHLQSALHDPGSYDYDFTYSGDVWYAKLRDDYGAAYEITVHYRAKNAFGAMRKSSLTAAVQRDCTWVGILNELRYDLIEIDKIRWESRNPP